MSNKEPTSEDNVKELVLECYVELLTEYGEDSEEEEIFRSLFKNDVRLLSILRRR